MVLEGQKFDHYQLKRRIGRGGMGEIYEARDIKMARSVAVKVLQTDMDSDSGIESSRLFRREMQAISSLEHPHILSLFEFGEEVDGNSVYMYMVMPLLEEFSLDRWLQKDNNASKLSLKDIAQLIHQAADALQYAHDKKIIHLDVKPANFLVSIVKGQHLPHLFLADFGLAKFTEATRGKTAMMGTAKYMAPEQFKAPVIASDQYSLAIMAYELLAGRVPVEGIDFQMMYQHIHESFEPPSKYRTDIPIAVDNVILRALAKKPEERYASISMFAQAFQDALQPGNDINITLVISKEEALSGVDTVVMLDDGQRFPVPIPVGVRDGQKFPLPGKGEVPADGRVAGNLILTVSILHSEQDNTFHPLQLSKKVEHLIVVSSDYQKLGVKLDKIFNNIAILQSTQLGNREAHKQFQTISQSINSMLVSSQQLPEQFQDISQRLDKIMESSQQLATKLMRISQNSSQSITDVPLIKIIREFPKGANTGLGLLFFLQIIVAAFILLSVILVGAGYSNIANQNILIKSQISTYTTKPNFVPKDPYINTGNLVLDDPLTKNSTSGWDQSGDCAFTKNGVYEVHRASGNLVTCIAENLLFKDFILEVNMSIAKGDCGGIIFRADGFNTDMFFRYYLFEVCQKGNYRLSLYSNGTANYSNLIVSTKSNYINIGNTAINTLAVIAQGNIVYLYINHSYVGKATDNSYSQGAIGFFADPLYGNSTVMNYKNIRVWKL